MTRIRTHYDNLKIATDAPIEVINAAYRGLCKKYHPDNNPGNPDAARIMVILNAAYEVLSDTDKRKQYDQWIAEQRTDTKEDRNSGSESPYARSDLEPESDYQERPGAYEKSGHSFGRHFADNWVLYVFSAIALIAILLVLYSVSPEHSVSSGTAQPLVNSFDSSAADYSAPTHTAPSLRPDVAGYPRSTGYAKGYSMKAMNGYSTVTVDNTQNDRDVFVRLFSLGLERPMPVRSFIILAHERFTVKKVTAGKYDIRYKFFESNNALRTDPFNLKEDRVRYSKITLTLHKVNEGKMHIYKISDEDFE